MTNDKALEIARAIVNGRRGLRGKDELNAICHALIDAQAEIERLLSDAVLGAMVRRIPAGSALCRYDDDVPWRVTCGSLARFESPEAAIRAAMLKEAGIHE